MDDDERFFLFFSFCEHKRSRNNKPKKKLFSSSLVSMIQSVNIHTFNLRDWKRREKKKGEKEIREKKGEAENGIFVSPLLLGS
jgi:hypothetical protein